MTLKKILLIDDTENRRIDFEKQFSKYSGLLEIVSNIRSNEDLNRFSAVIVHESFESKTIKIDDIIEECLDKNIFVVRFSGGKNDEIKSENEIILSRFTLQSNLEAFLENIKNNPEQRPNSKLLLYGKRFVLVQLLNLRKEFILFYISRKGSFNLKEYVESILDPENIVFENFDNNLTLKQFLLNIRKISQLIDKEI